MQLKIAFLTLLLTLSILRAEAQDTLLVFHPTAYNLELFQSMHTGGILDLEGIHLLGVYHEDEAYDYQGSVEYIASSDSSGGMLSMSLRVISGRTEQAGLFSDTLWSAGFRELFECSVAAIFLGGPDIPASVYGEEAHLLTSVTDPYRHYMELSFLFHLLGGEQDPGKEPMIRSHPDYMVLGICLGMQTMHVATGGRMVQDIPSELYGLLTAEKVLALDPDQMHRNYMDRLQSGCEGPTSYHFHHVGIQKRSPLSSLAGARSGPLVLSSHHQALQEPFGPWKVIATSMDGLVPEAILHTSYPSVIGLQFHPEKPGLFDPSIRQAAACGETINFQEEIADQVSHDFHLELWELVEKMIRKSARKKQGTQG